jgi:membrane-associated phospholipid phosphatase/MFS family permease
MSISAHPLASAPKRTARAAPSVAAVGLASLVAFAVAALGAGLGRAVTTSYLPVLLDRIAEGPGVIGTVMLVNAVAGFAVPLVVGVWSDRLRASGRGRALPFILGGSLLSALGLAAVALGSGSSYLALAVSGGVAYVGVNAVTTAHRALVPENFSPGERARATGAQEFLMLVGGLAGLAAGGVLVEIALWAPFALAAAAMPLFALPTVVRMRGREASAEVGPARAARPGSYYLRAALRPGVRAVLSAQLLWVLGYAALPAFFVLYAERVLGLRPSAAAAWLVGFGVVTGATMLLAGRARRQERHRSLLLLGVALMGGGFLAVAASSSSLFAGPGLVAAAVGFGLVSTIGFPFFAAFIPPGEAGGYTALYFSVRAIASAIALPAAGWAIAVTGSYRTLYVFGGVATLLALVPLARVGGAPRTHEARTRALARLPRPRWLLGWTGAVVGASGLVLGFGALVGTTRLSWIDEALFRAANHLGPGPNLLWQLADPHLRNYVLLILLAVGAAALTEARRIPIVLTFVTLSWILAFGLHAAIHAVWNRPRPEETLGAADVVLNGRHWDHIASFPSGHVVITTALVVSTVRLFPALRLPLWSYLAVVAFTRVFFGAHFPLDVVAGLAIGYVSARAIHVLLAEMSFLQPCPAPAQHERAGVGRLRRVRLGFSTGAPVGHAPCP